MSNDLPARWRDDAETPAELRELGRVLESLNEPPPAGARARVWEKVEQPRRRPVLRPVVWGGLAVAAAGVLAVIWAPTMVPADIGQVELVLGSAPLHHDGAATGVGATIGDDSRLTTGKDGRAVVRLLDVGVAFLSESTDATVTAAPSIVLRRGTVVTSVQPRGQRAPFRVLAGDYQVEVIGTLFQVTRTNDDVQVQVHEGKVEVRGPSGRTLVGAGESFSARGRAVAPITDEALRRLGAEVRISALGQPVEAAPVAAKPRPRLVRVPDPAPAPAPVETSSDTTRAEPEPEPEPEPTAAEPAEPELASELAAYQAARQAAKTDLEGAIRRYEAQLDAYPNGRLAPEARLNVIGAAMQLEAWDKASFHVDVFIKIYPKSERVAEVRFLRAEIARYRHDCAAALPDYDAALKSPRRVGDAMFFKAWCLLQHDKTNEALPLLERYLERFPVGRHAREARDKVGEIRALKK